MKNYSYTIVLSIAGSDSGGGAGIQADLKTFSALGCFGTSAITAVTVQNTLGVQAIHTIPPAIVSAQIKAVLDDMKPAAIKIGMVPDAAIAEAIAGALATIKVPVVFDPVMVSGSGSQLVKEETIEWFKTQLFPLCTLVTPNTNEATALTGIQINNLNDMKTAARQLLQTGCNAVLLTGGHLQSSELHDVYVDKWGTEQVFTSNFIQSKNLHGTGCTLSSAIAALLANGTAMPQAIKEAVQYVQDAIEQGKDVKTGEGVGPLNHFYHPQKSNKHGTR